MELELARRAALAPRPKPQVMVKADIYRGFDLVSRTVLKARVGAGEPAAEGSGDRDFDNANTRYLKALVRMFTGNRSGQLCFVAPMAGLALPGRALLNPQLYRSLELVQSRSAGLPFFLIRAYPRWNA